MHISLPHHPPPKSLFTHIIFLLGGDVWRDLKSTREMKRTLKFSDEELEIVKCSIGKAGYFGDVFCWR